METLTPRPAEPLPRAPHRAWPWLAGLVLLVSLHFWFPGVGAGRRNDTYSTAAEGKKAFFLLVNADPAGRFIEARRNLVPVGQLVYEPRGRLGGYGEAPVICLLGPARYPHAAEWKQLLEWVAAGGRLLIAARADDPELEIKPLSIRVRDAGRAIDARGKSVVTSLVAGGDLAWRSRGEIVASPSARRLVQADGSTQAVGQSHGVGAVVVVASDAVFSNESLAYGEQEGAVLAYRLLAATGGTGVVYFDESLNVLGTAKVVGILFDPPLRSLTVQLLIVVLLFAWWGSRRFGPPARETVGARQNIVEHTDAVGLLHYKSREGGAALRSYLRQLIAELKLKTHRGREERVLEPIARRLGRPTGDVRRLLAASTRAARSTNLERRTAARLIRNLSVIRRAARRLRSQSS